MKHILLTLVSAAVLIFPAAAQDKKESTVEAKAGEPPSAVITKRIFTIKHANVDNLAQVLSIFKCQVIPNANLQVVAVSAPANIMPALEEVIKRLDVPPAPSVLPVRSNVELIIYLLLGSEQSSSFVLPPELQPAIGQLKSLFHYRGFRLLDTMLARARNEEGFLASGIVAVGPAEQPKSPYTFRVKSIHIAPGEKGRVIRLSGLKLDWQVPVPVTTDKNDTRFSFMAITIETNIDVGEGQKVVVGKSSFSGSDQALILVLTARVVD